MQIFGTAFLNIIIKCVITHHVGLASLEQFGIPDCGRGIQDRILKLLALNLLMSSLTVGLNQRLLKQRKTQEYRQQLDLQVLQKHELNRRRSGTDDYESHHKHHRSRAIAHSGTQGQHRHHHSSVLPLITRKPYQQAEDQSDNLATIDTQLQTIQYLNDCERIIENLKKLTNISISKLKSGRTRTASEDHYNNYYSNLKDSRSGSRQGTFFQAKKSRYEQQSQADQCTQPHNQRLQKPSSKVIGDEKNGKHKLIPSSRSNRTQDCHPERYHKNQDQSSQNPEVLKIKSPVHQNCQQVGKDRRIEKIEVVKDGCQMTGSKNIKTETAQNNRVHVNIQNQQMAQEQALLQSAHRGLRVDRKKQKIFFRYIGQAKTRGAQLCNKIAEFRLKNKSEIIPSNLDPNSQETLIEAKKQPLESQQPTKPINDQQKINAVPETRDSQEQPRQPAFKNTVKFICKQVDIKIESPVRAQKKTTQASEGSKQPQTKPIPIASDTTQ